MAASDWTQQTRSSVRFFFFSNAQYLEVKESAIPAKNGLHCSTTQDKLTGMAL
jgi:hypothetical protein